LKNQDFQRIRQEGKVFSGHNLAIAVLKRGDQEESRFGYIVSLKISKKAVVRNKIRRVLKEAVRVREIPVGYDCVFLTKPGITKMASREITKEVGLLLNNL
jgi:ribonuclease P protein component